MTKRLWILLALLPIAASATGNNRDDRQIQDQQQHQQQGQKQAQGQWQSAFATSTSEAASTNEGNELSVNTEYDDGPADLVLVPNNNSEPCLRVFGLAFGNDNASGMFGVPWRSAACDYGKAAADAFAGGERELGWFWNCHKRSLYKPFKDKGESKEQAIEDCTSMAVGEVTAQATIAKLREDLEFLQRERRIERENCNKAKTRIAESCRGDK